MLVPVAAASWLYRAIKRDLRRAALFLWMMPLPAARSSMLIAACTASVEVSCSPSAIASRAFRTKVFAAERYDWFRKRRRSPTRIRFNADFEFAKIDRLSAFPKRATPVPEFNTKRTSATTITSQLYQR